MLELTTIENSNSTQPDVQLLWVQLYESFHATWINLKPQLLGNEMQQNNQITILAEMVYENSCSQECFHHTYEQIHHEIGIDPYKLLVAASTRSSSPDVMGRQSSYSGSSKKKLGKGMHYIDFVQKKYKKYNPDYKSKALTVLLALFLCTISCLLGNEQI